MEKVTSLTDYVGDGFYNLVLDTLLKNKQMIVFVNSKRRAEAVAEKLAKLVFRFKNNFDFKINFERLSSLKEDILSTLSHPTKQCERLGFCVERGVAFHHSGLAPKQREIVEENFRNSAIKVIVATPTLAYGLNLPAYRVVVLDLKRFSSTGMGWIPVLDYLQMSGRAGRPGNDDKGESIIVAKTFDEKMKIVDRYIYGESEDILSKLAVEPALRTYLLSLISLGFINSKESMIDFFERTFWAYQYGDMDKLERILLKMLDMLVDFGFVEIEKKEIGIREEKKHDNLFTSANLLKRKSKNKNERLKATKKGERVSQLYLDPITGHKFFEVLDKLDLILSKSKTINDFALLHTFVNTLEMWPLLRVKIKEYDIYDEIIFKETFLDHVPTQFMPEYQDFVNSVKTTCALYDWINEVDEETLLEKYDIRPGELRVKLDNLDWLIYAFQELARIRDNKENLNIILKETEKLRLRAKYGVKEELLGLLRLKGIGRVKARKLFNYGIRTIGDLKKSKELKRILGEKTAEKVLKQIE